MARKFLLLIPLVLMIAACGTVATPVFEEQLEETRVAQAATSDAETAAAPTATATTVPSETALPTNTPAPTSTPVPATNTPEPATATSEPTEAPTEASVNAAPPAGDPANGQMLFNTFEAAANFACSTCHRVDSEQQLIGPGLLNVSIRAETRVPGQSAAEYIRNSILRPSDYVVENYPDKLMPQVYSTVFTETEINDLVAYLFTLKG